MRVIKSVDVSLLVKNPELAAQWHPTKNDDLTPNDFTTGSGKKVWWKCVKYNTHEWEATIASRAIGNNGCPICAGQKVLKGFNDLATLKPYISQQWHSDKNGELTPEMFTVGSSKKVWWKCTRGHEWQSKISHRVNGSNCPDCWKRNQTSFPEQAIYFYMKKSFSDTLSRYKYNDKVEIDIFIPSLNIGIEYDGFYYHNEKFIANNKKEKYLVGEGINFLRIKESRNNLESSYLNENVIFCSNKPSDFQLTQVIKICFDYIYTNIIFTPYITDIDVERDRARIYDTYIEGEAKESLSAKHPELSAQWHPTKNLSIKPDMLRPGTNKKVWWICEKEHEWQATINSRVQGSGCPDCAGIRANIENNLQTLNPDLSR